MITKWGHNMFENNIIDLALNGKWRSALSNHISESCARPVRWCARIGATFFMQDCDSDGISDPVCSNIYGQFGVIQSSKGCIDSWPTGKCLSK